MNEQLNYAILKKKLLSEIDAIKGEIRAEIILLQAYVEFMIDEIIEILIESNSMRGTNVRLNLKLQLLKDMNWLPKDFVDDLSKLAAIRGFVAHRIDVYDEKTRNDIESKFKQIKLIDKSQESLFPKNESLQKHIRTILELYFDILHYIYTEIYGMKLKSSIKNYSVRDNYRFYKEGDDIVIQFDEV